MSKELERWFKDLPNKLQRELAADIKRIADGLADDIKEAAPVRTGKLKDSVRVRRGRKTLELYVEAGGKATTREYGRGGYEREVTVGQGENQNIPRGAEGVSYDYSLGVEFGNERTPAQPFFYSTFRAKQDQVRQEIEEAVVRAVARA